LVLQFADALFAVIFPGQNLIELEVALHPPKLDSCLYEQDINFELPSGTRILWGWKTILDNFVGNEIAISPSDQELFIFTRGGDEYLITSYKEESNQNNLYLSVSQA
jgi:hypothetical protein